MIISTKGRYGIRVMIDLAQHGEDGYIPLKTIAERQGISEKYLESILKVLVQEKLLESDAAPKLQEIPAPERFDDAERLCFEQCFAGLGQSEAAQECERLDYYSARFEAFLHQAQQKAASGQGLPCRLGLAAGAVAALILL